MKFRDIMRNVETLAISGDAEITGIAYDSRKVKPGFLFLAMRGESSDGNRFVDAALNAGSTGIVTDSQTTVTPANIAFARVAHGRRALAKISANFFERPSDRLKLTGVTG